MWESCTSNHWQQPPESNLARCTSIDLLAKKNDVEYKDFGTFVLQAEGHEDFRFSRPGGFDIEWEDTYFALLWWLYPPAWRGKGGKETARSFRNRSFLNKRSLGARQGNRGLLLNKSQLIEFRE